MFEDPQVRHVNMAVVIDDPARGDIRVVGQPIDMSRTPPTIRNALPDIGANTAEVLAEMGCSEHEITALLQENAI